MAAPASSACRRHLGLYQAAPVNNRLITGAPLWHRVAPASATAAAQLSNPAARHAMTAPAGRDRPELKAHWMPIQIVRTAWSPQRASQASESSTPAPAPAYAGKHLRTGPGQRTSPADKLRVRSAPTAPRPVPGWGSHPSDQAPAVCCRVKAPASGKQRVTHKVGLHGLPQIYAKCHICGLNFSDFKGPLSQIYTDVTFVVLGIKDCN